MSSNGTIVKGATRLEWIDSLKGISILLVVYYHCIILPYTAPFKSELFSKTIFDSFNYFIAYNLAPLRMPLFFMISGFLVSSSVVRKSWKEVSEKRIYILVYVFVLWSIIQNFSILLLGSESSQEGLNNSIYAKNIIDFAQLLALGSNSLWYLYALVVYFVVTKLFNKYGLALLLIAACASLSLMNWKFPFPYKSMVYCFFFFALGVFYGGAIFSYVNQLSLKRGLIILAVGLCCTLFMKFVHFEVNIVKSLVYIYIFTFTVMLLFKFGLKLKILSFLGRRTLPIYIMHRPILEVTLVIITPLITRIDIFNKSEHLLYSLLYPLLATSFCIAIPLLVYRYTSSGFGAYLFSYKR
ncbi:hypothetical protein RJ44_00430 [Alteromonas macleodii]|uniref:acyltransferase family protein n=1 Tax=Alteromonas macleodii TaxID=28108 RepID=UPI00057C9A99|nr:acyltransferase family protein [Alteromonas macleodii]KHT61260.1 hypothetical protein RJ44_00430 [Alteromonas macleodii]